MFVVSRICTLLFLLSIPTAIGFALTRLFAGRRGDPSTTPFRNRLYSGLKRMACAWGHRDCLVRDCFCRAGLLESRHDASR